MARCGVYSLWLVVCERRSLVNGMVPGLEDNDRR